MSEKKLLTVGGLLAHVSDEIAGGRMDRDDPAEFRGEDGIVYRASVEDGRIRWFVAKRPDAGYNRYPVRPCDCDHQWAWVASGEENEDPVQIHCICCGEDDVCERCNVEDLTDGLCI
jgi:hypothetical protein